MLPVVQVFDGHKQFRLQILQVVFVSASAGVSDSPNSYTTHLAGLPVIQSGV